MKKTFTYQALVKSLLLLLLVGQFWTSLATHCYWMFDAESELVEIGTENTEWEGEDTKEKKDKFSIDLYKLESGSVNDIISMFYLEKLFLIHHSEIVTPPPESLIS